jgi:hypothetical protein
VSIVRWTAEGRIKVATLPNVLQTSATNWRVSIFNLEWPGLPSLAGNRIDVQYYWASLPDSGTWPLPVTDSSQSQPVDSYPPFDNDVSTRIQRFYASATWVGTTVQVAAEDSLQPGWVPVYIRITTNNTGDQPRYSWLWIAPWDSTSILVDSNGDPLPLDVNSSTLSSVTIGTSVAIDGGTP